MNARDLLTAAEGQARERSERDTENVNIFLDDVGQPPMAWVRGASEGPPIGEDLQGRNSAPCVQVWNSGQCVWNVDDED